MWNNRITALQDPTYAQDAATKNYVDSNTWSIAGNIITSTNKLGSTNNIDVSIVRNNVNKISCGNTSIQVSNSLYIRKVTDDVLVEDPDNANLYLGCTTLAVGDTFLISIGKPSNKIYWTNGTNAYVIIDAQYGIRFRVNGADIIVLYPTYMVMSKELSMYSNKISSVLDPTNAQDAATKNYVDTKFVFKAGDTMTGNLTFDGTGRNVTLIATNIADTKSFGIGITPIVASIIFARNVNNTTCTINATDFIYKSGTTFGLRSNATQTTIYNPLTMKIILLIMF